MIYNDKYSEKNLGNNENCSNKELIYEVSLKELNNEINQLEKIYPKIYHIVGISEYLIKKGFTFEKATVGGGFNEITHSGDAAYYADYTDFYMFRDHFQSDFEKAEKRKRENSGGWITSLNYGFININLHKDSLSVCLNLDVLCEVNLNMIWKNVDDNDLMTIKDINRYIFNEQVI